jgi:hypothetical protein
MDLFDACEEGSIRDRDLTRLGGQAGCFCMLLRCSCCGRYRFVARDSLCCGRGSKCNGEGNRGRVVISVEAALSDGERSIWDQGGLGMRASNASVGLGVIVSVLESAGTSISGLGVLNDWSPGRGSRTIASRAVAHILHFDAEIVVSVPMLGVTERRRMAGKGRGQLRGHNRTPVHVVEDSVFGEGEEKVDIRSYICRGLAHIVGPRWL